MTVSTIVHSGAAYRAAESLADAIRSMPEWEEWESARALLRTDPTFQSLATRHRAVAREVQRSGLPAETATALHTELDSLRQQMDQHPAAVRQQAAVLGLVGLLRSVNATLSEALGFDFVRVAAPPAPGGCCG